MNTVPVVILFVQQQFPLWIERSLEKLMFYKQQFSNDGPSTTRFEQTGDRYEKVDEKYDGITHH